MAAVSLFCTQIWPPWRHVKTIFTHRASLHKQEWLWWRDFCDGAKMLRADPESGASHIR